MRIVSEPSAFFFNPSVVLPKLQRPITFSTKSFDVADDAYVDVERHMAAAMARD